MKKVCSCKKGYSSPYDGICRFCREDLLSRAEGRKFGVRSRGDGLSLEQYEKYLISKGKLR